MVSEKLRIAIYLSPKKAYTIAHEAGLHPSTLSRLLNIEDAKPGDPRVIAIGKVVGVAEEECFKTDSGGLN